MKSLPPPWRALPSVVLRRRGWRMWRRGPASAKARSTSISGGKEELFEAVVRAMLLPNLEQLEALAATYEGPSAILLERLC